MNNSASIVLIGIAGYGNLYLKRLLDDGEKLNATIAGVVDIFPEKSDSYERILERDIPVFKSIEEFYDHHQADLAIISTPIHLHASQTCYALTHGSHVLCEKPICASVEDARKMMETRNQTGKFVAIGFNWSFSHSVQRLKQEVMAGNFGKPKRMKTIVNWPRNQQYYERNGWAGRLFSDDGSAILDSVANNATSHFLHHMFYLLGDKVDESAKLRDVTAELYRANEIESFDTCAVKAVTEDDVEVFYYATHAVNEEFGPTYIYEFEQAILFNDEKNEKVIARFHDGTEKIYSAPEKDHMQKLETCIQAVLQGNHRIECGPEAAMTHLLCITTMHESVPDIHKFPETLIQLNEKTSVTWVEGLSESLIECYEKWCLPNDLEVAWSKRGETIQMVR